MDILGDCVCKAIWGDGVGGGLVYARRLGAPAVLPHDFGHALAPDRLAFIAQAASDAQRADAALFGVEDLLDLLGQLRVASRPLAGRIALPLIVAAWETSMALHIMRSPRVRDYLP